MKSIREHLEALPEPFRSQALNNAQRQKDQRPSQASALNLAFSWFATQEGKPYWCGLYRALAGKTPNPSDPIEQHPDFIRAQALYKQVSAESGQPEEANQHQTTTTVKYSDQPVANPTLVFGTDVSTMSANDCINAIKGNNAQIKAFEETGISSAYITERVNGIKAANEVLVKRLDSFASAPAAQPVTA